jgi:hypothetical protein
VGNVSLPTLVFLSVPNTGDAVGHRRHQVAVRGDLLG